MREFKILTVLTLTLLAVNGQLMDDNSTNYHNIMFNRMFNMSRYHTYPFDVWKNLDFEQIYQRLEAASNDTEDGKPSKFDEIKSKLDEVSTKYLSPQCYDDIKHMFKALQDFFGATKSLLSGTCELLKTNKSIEECKNNFTTIIKNNFWVVQMIDSSGKLNAGVNMGNHQHLGRYADCKRIYVERSTRPFQAAYCRATFQLPVPESAAIVSEDCLGIPLQNGIGNPRFFNRSCEPKRNFARMKWGLCAPSTCDTRNMTIIFRIMLPPTNNFCNVTVVCENVRFNLKIDLRFIGTVCVLCLVGLIMIIGTIYDIFFYQSALAEHVNEHKYVFVHKTDAHIIDDHKANGDTHDMILFDDRTRDEYYDALPAYCKLALAFSIYTNGANILSVDVKPNEFPAINAIKALSTAWLISILAHLYMIGYIDNTKMIPKFIYRLCFQMINNGSFVSDTFLLLSGFLMAYWFMKRQHGRVLKSPIFWLKFYFRRWLRICPPLFILIIVLLFVWKYVIRGPMWTVYFFNSCSPLRCVSTYWTNFLFLNNFLRTDSPCLAVTQMLAVDMQIYLFAPLLFSLYLKFPKIGLGVVGFLVVLSVAFQGVSIWYNSLPPSLITTVDVNSFDVPMSKYYNKIFIKPWMRWNAFFIGMILGHLVARVKRGLGIRIGKNLTGLLWFLAIVLCSCCVYGLTGYVRGYPMPIAIVVIYGMLSRLVWSLSVGAILFLCVTNRGGIVEWIFSWPFWGPMSRLTYSAFLICPFVIAYTYTSSQAGIHLSTFNMVYFSWGAIIMTYLLAFIYHLAFEAPYLVMRRLFCFKSILGCHDKLEIELNEIKRNITPGNVYVEQNSSSKHFEENRLLPAAKIISNDGSVELKSVSKL